MAVLVNVFVSMMSAPAARVLAMDGADHVRTRQDQEIAVALQILGVILEALATEVGVGQPVSLNHRAHRAIEQQYPAIEERGQVVQNRIH